MHVIPSYINKAYPMQQKKEVPNCLSEPCILNTLGTPQNEIGWYKSKNLNAPVLVESVKKSVEKVRIPFLLTWVAFPISWADGTKFAGCYFHPFHLFFNPHFHVLFLISHFLNTIGNEI
jgi:hypothetical protein